LAKSKKKSPYHFIVKVLQNGTTLSETHYPVTQKKSVLALTNFGKGPLVLPHYPFHNNKLEFLKFDGKNPYLLVNYKWEGFTTSDGDLINLNRRTNGAEEIKLSRGDYGSISYKDVRIMFKIAVYKPKKFEKASKKDRSYSASLLSLALPHKEERQNFGSSFLIGAVLFGLIVTGLTILSRPKTTSVAQMSVEYVLPFIDKDYFATAPEALQNKLDRDQAIPSVLNYYTALAGLLYNWQGYDQSEMFSSTVEEYRQLYQQTTERKNDLLQQQNQTDEKNLTSRSSAVIFIPTVIGESINGQVQRGLDKINLLHKGFDQSLEKRREFLKTFASIEPHQFEEYKGIKTSNTALSKLAKIKVFNRPTDEELMYKEAEDLAKDAQLHRYNIKNNISKNDILDPYEDSPIGMPENYRYGSGISDIEYSSLDEKLYVIEASRFGKVFKPQKIREPLIGELDKNLVSNYIRKNRYQLQQCYELAIRRNDSAAGSMLWSWRIDTRGKASDVNLVKSTISDSKMTRCIQQKIAKWQFPRPRRGSVEIRYPFDFRPAKG